jgi:hypothetical protein
MPRLRRYRIFISHAWAYAEHQRITEFLGSIPNFRYSDYSVPQSNPLNTSNSNMLKAALKRRISLCHVVLISAGMEVNYREFVLFELNHSIVMRKPIIGIAPIGAQQFPKVVRESALEIVGWNRFSIVNAIRRYAL